MCLTYLKRQEEAIQAATHIIELKLDNIADGVLLARVELSPLDATRACARRHRVGEAAEVFGRGLHARGHHRVRAGRSRSAERDLNIGEGHVRRRAQLHRAVVSRLDRDETRALAGVREALRGRDDCYSVSVAGGSGERRAAIETNPDIDPEFKRESDRRLRRRDQGGSQAEYASAFNAANHFASRRQPEQGQDTRRDRREGSHARRTGRRSEADPGAAAECIPSDF